MRDSVLRKIITHVMYRMHFLPDDVYLKIMFRVMMGKRLKLEAPVTFNEKLQWLKLYDRNPVYTSLVDKIAVKQVVSEMFGKGLVPNTLAIWNSAEDIRTEELPDKFVVKTNHDSGGVAVCRDKRLFDLKREKNRLRKGMSKNYYWECREWPYRDVVPRVFAEEYLEADGDDLADYKLFRFSNGKVITLVCEGRALGVRMKKTFFDEQWNALELSEGGHGTNPEHPRPANFKRMLEIAGELGEGIPFVRVDFYECRKHLYFGEMTFYPNGGYERFEPCSWDEVFGGWIDLTGVNHN